MRLKRGDRAVITGASRGIGECFASELSRLGIDLLLIARSGEDLQRVSAQVAGRVKVDTLRMDLTEELPSDAQLGRLDLLINNAGFGLRGRFGEQPVERLAQMVDLNVKALVQLSHQVLPQMLERRRGGIINVASNAAFQPLPFMAVYGASKAFVLSFSEALHREYVHDGLSILGLCPGSTKTDFHAVAGNSPFLMRIGETPESVVHTGLRALEQNRSSVVSGWMNVVAALATRAVPRQWAATMAGELMKER